MEKKKIVIPTLTFNGDYFKCPKCGWIYPDRCVYWGMWRMAHPANSAATRRLSAFSEHTSYDF